MDFSPFFWITLPITSNHGHLCPLKALHVLHPSRAEPIYFRRPAMEASGDSEADLEPLTGLAVLTMEEDAAADGDDTESCSHDAPDNIHTDHNNFNNEDDDDVVDDVGVDAVTDDDDDDDDDANMEHERVLTWSPEEVTGLEEEEVVDSAEEDRLFWENCLASGYP